VGLLLYESNNFHRRSESLAELNVSRNQVVNVQDLEKLPYLASGMWDLCRNFKLENFV